VVSGGGETGKQAAVLGRGAGRGVDESGFHVV